MEPSKRAVDRISSELKTRLGEKQGKLPVVDIKGDTGVCPGCSNEVKIIDPGPGVRWMKIQGRCATCSTEFIVLGPGFQDSEDAPDMPAQDPDGEGSNPTYRLTGSGHEHVIQMDANGSGTSSEVNDHSHRVIAGSVQSAAGHTHRLENSAKTRAGNMDNRERFEKLMDNGDEEGGIMDVPEAEVIKFFTEHPNPTDYAFHEHSEEKGWNTHQAEAVAYRLATRYTQFRTGGRSKGVRPKNVVSEEESMGQQVELEHTANVDDALKIAWDHLAEVPNSKYYTFLATIEKVLKAGPDHPLFKKMQELTEEAEDLPSEH